MSHPGDEYRATDAGYTSKDIYHVDFNMPTFREGQIAVMNLVRGKLGLGAREAYELTEKYPNLSADEIIAKLQPSKDTAATPRYSSKLAVRGWLVISRLFPEHSGYHDHLTDDIREKIRLDEHAQVHELVYKAEADELIGNVRRLALD